MAYSISSRVRYNTSGRGTCRRIEGGNHMGDLKAMGMCSKCDRVYFLLRIHNWLYHRGR